MKNLLKKIVFATIVVALTGCVNDNWDTPKQDDCVAPTHHITGSTTPVLIAKNKDVATVWAAAPVTPLGVLYTADDIVEGYVISSEEGGNFYKNMYIQPLDGSKGFNLSINVGDLYNNKFEPGRKVYLKLKGLGYTNPPGFSRGLVFGDVPTDIYAVDRLSENKYKQHLFSSCDIISEDAIVKNISLAQALSDTYLNNLVEISGVQFKTFCNTTYATQGFDTSLQVSDGVGAATIAVRTSKYANFAGDFVPSGNGKLRGVLTKYGTGIGASTYQIILRTQRDVKFTNPRVLPVAPPSPPAKIGASASTFNATLNENFTSYTAPTNDATIPKYINQADVNIKFWDIKTFNNNKYLQTQAFGVTGPVKNYFVVPVNFTTANGLSFKTLDGYNNGVPLKVYYSTNYVPGTKMNTATLVDITSNFVLADGRLSSPSTSNSYAVNFTPSGLFSFPDTLTGNGYIIFEYDSGECNTTTTYQIDDIIIN
jgi:hypothetical protein